MVRGLGMSSSLLVITGGTPQAWVGCGQAQGPAGGLGTAVPAACPGPVLAVAAGHCRGPGGLDEPNKRQCQAAGEVGGWGRGRPCPRGEPSRPAPGGARGRGPSPVLLQRRSDCADFTV